MKRILAIAASLILVVISANSQSEKKEAPPPPPPKRIDEKVKFTPPKIVKDDEVQGKQEPKVIVDEKVQVKKSPPLLPKRIDEKVKFTPPKILKNEELQVKDSPVITVKGTLADDFYKRNPSVSDILRKGNIITLKMKDGTTENYDMSKKDEDKTFTEKYGRSPIPPPPPPKVNLTKFKPPVIIAKGEKADDFYKRNASVKEILKQGNTITLKMKDGTSKEYNVTNKDEMKSFTDQYGELPFSPPPPKQKTKE